MNKFIFIAFIFSLAIACKRDPELKKLGDGHNHTHLDLNIPAGLPPLPIPVHNPMTVEGVALGRKLFYDNILSANNTQNCGSCHGLKTYFVDSNKQFSTGIDGIAGERNSMPLFNIGYAKDFFWDGGAADLETQVIGPITNPVEMHETIANVINKLNNHPEYPALFKKVFGVDTVSTVYLMKAIAQFERTILSGNSKYDQYKLGKVALTEIELRGLEIYTNENKGDCTHCHSLGSTFTDFEYRNTGLDSIPVDKGRGRITMNPNDDGKFKTPTLRNIAMTAPYMHDGRFPNLRFAIEHYNKHFKYTANLDPQMEVRIKNTMTEDDITDLIAFLNTLTDVDFVNKVELDKP
jgi:cytochrome c peroxidase